MFMSDPIFRLEGIVKTKEETTDFEGPLTLILQLLSKDKIEIRDISISLILEQYLEYLEGMAELDLDVASEFVAMASHLAYIKTKMLLTGDEEISELEQLMTSLELLQSGDVYLQIKSASEALSGMYARGGAMMPCPPEYLPVNNEYIYTHSSDQLFEAIMRVIGRENVRIGSINPRKPVYPVRIVYSIREKTYEILDRLGRGGKMNVPALFYESESRAELIAAFLAVLELCRVGSVLISGVENKMIISLTGRTPDPEEYSYFDEF